MDKLLEVLRIQSVSRNQKRMYQYLITEVKNIPGCKVTKSQGNIYVTKGDGPYPCVVSHMDTVHAIVADLTILSVDGMLTGFNRKTMTQTGIGGDDKVGIYITLESLRKFDNIKAVFFKDEEIGCVGSYLADMKFFEDTTYVLQCDRKGNKDFVTKAGWTPLSDAAFQTAVLPTLGDFGYSFSDGMMTDVMALKECGLEVACANISCGYYNPHSPNEYVIVDEVMKCKEMVFGIITSLGQEIFPHHYDDRFGGYDDDILGIDVGLNSIMRRFPSTVSKSEKHWWDDDKEYNELIMGTKELCYDCYQRAAVLHGLCAECYDFYTNHAPKKKITSDTVNRIFSKPTF